MFARRLLLYLPHFVPRFRPIRELASHTIKNSGSHGSETSGRECTQVFILSLQLQDPFSSFFATRPNRCKLDMSCFSFGTYIVSMVLRIVPPEKFLVIPKTWCLDLLPDVIRACSSTKSLAPCRIKRPQMILRTSKLVLLRCCNRHTF